MFRNLEAEQARQGLTNSQMADILGVSRSTYEAKKRNGNFTRPQIAKMIALFKCTFEYLFADDEEMENSEQKAG